MARTLFIWAALLSAAACGPAGGPDGQTLNVGDFDTSGSPARRIDGGVTDSGVGCVGPDLSSLHARVFMPRCTNAGCHVGNDAPEGLDLSTDVDTLAARLRQPSRESPTGMPLVTPGQPASSWLYLKVYLRTPLIGESMPVDDRLSDCELESLRAWIQDSQ